MRTLKTLVYQGIYYSGRPLRDGGLTILSYHSLDEEGTTGISVPPRLFADQMAVLAAEGCTSLTMREVAAHLAEGRPFPPRAVAITFDDGFANVYTEGGPILARYGLCSTVYIITGMIGAVIDWTDTGVSLPALPLMDWTQIRAFAAAGHEIGAHTIQHGFLTRLPPAAREKELREPRQLLEHELGTPIQAFAYPQGDYNAAVIAATRAAGYTTAVTIDQGRVGAHDDPFRLRRIHVGDGTTPVRLRACVQPTIGPTYWAINLLIRRVLGHRRWPRPAFGTIQSSHTRPLPPHP